MKLEVKSVKQTSIYGKELLYVVIGEGDARVIMNVGQKTFDGVEELITGKKKVVEPKKGGNEEGK